MPTMQRASPRGRSAAQTSLPPLTAAIETARAGAVRTAVEDLAQVAGDLDAQVRQFRLR